MTEARQSEAEDRPIASLASRLLVHGYNTQAELAVGRDFDFAVLPGEVPADPQLWVRVFRRLKIMSGLNPWATGEAEMGRIEIGLGDKHLRYAITFHNAKGNEHALVGQPEHLGSYAAAREAGLLYRRSKAAQSAGEA